jgi:hypothetical protein
MAESLDFTILRGCDYRIRMRLNQPPNANELGAITGWHVVFEVRQTRGAAPILSVNGMLADVSRAAELGVFDFVLPAAQTATLTERTYFYAIRRTDALFVDVFTKGQLGVESF